MPAISWDGSKTVDVETNDINYRVYDSCHHTAGDPPHCVGGYWYYSGGASTIHGTVVASTSTIFCNGKPIARQNDSVTETETPHVSGEPTSNHTGGTGTIVLGNNRNVFSGGLSIACIGSQVKTHSTPSTTILDGSPNVFIGG